MTVLFFQNKALVVSYLISLSMILSELPIWVRLIVPLILFWRWLAEKKVLEIPSRWTTNLTLLVVVGILLFDFKTLLGREASSTLIVLLASLKILEMRTERDQVFVLLLGLGLAGFKFLFTMDFWVLLPSLASLLFILYNFIDPAAFGLGRWNWRYSYVFKLFLVSLPVALLLFVMFPRFKSPFRAGAQTQAQSGFADDLSPGSVSSLVRIKTPVLRATFQDGAPLRPEDLYWRGEVLTRSEGLSWRKEVSAPDETRMTEDYTYSVILEPHQRNWLFAFSGTKNLRSDDVTVVERGNKVFRSLSPIFDRIQYRGTATLQPIARPKFTEEYLQYPDSLRTEKMETLLSELRKNTTSNADKVKNLSRYFSDQEFYYTLEPGIVETLEEFIFESKKGFCEHYAGSFATLLRMLGVPARVIVGYQGGERNSFGNYWLITQADAHAWIEYVNDQGDWVSMDPTGLVAPLRVELGGQAYFDLSPEDQRSGDMSALRNRTKRGLAFFWDQATLFIDNFNYAWNTFLLEFDREKQKEWLQSLHLSLGSLFFIVVVAAFLISLLVSKMGKTRIKQNSLQKLFNEIETWALKQGVIRRSDEDPLNFLRRMKAQFPRLESILTRAEDVYFRQIYQEKEVPKKDIGAIRVQWHEIRKSQN